MIIAKSSPLSLKGVILIVVLLIILVITILFSISIKKAYKRFNTYKPSVINTKYGDVSYIEQGEGVPIIVFHGITGGYDQGLVSMKNTFGEDIWDYRIISPSRFGYPGSDMPQVSTPKEQAECFSELLNELEIDKAYLFATSAGGAPAIRFALDYPKKTLGLILLSSGAPANKDVSEVESAPMFIFTDFMMWSCVTLAKPVLLEMFGVSKSDLENASVQDINDINDLFDTMLPISNRSDGIKNDNNATNVDMVLNYDEYKVEDIASPVLIIHAKDDSMASYEEIIEMGNRLEDVEFVIFDKGGHLLFGSGDSSKQKIIDFLDK